MALAPLFSGCEVLHCVYTPHLRPFICRWAFQLRPTPWLPRKELRCEHSRCMYLFELQCFPDIYRSGTAGSYSNSIFNVLRASALFHQLPGVYIPLVNCRSASLFKECMNKPPHVPQAPFLVVVPNTRFVSMIHFHSPAGGHSKSARFLLEMEVGE